MEYGLGRNKLQDIYKKLANIVLILLLMEYGLGPAPLKT